MAMMEEGGEEGVEGEHGGERRQKREMAKRRRPTWLRERRRVSREWSGREERGRERVKWQAGCESWEQRRWRVLAARRQSKRREGMGPTKVLMGGGGGGADKVESAEGVRWGMRPERLELRGHRNG